MWPNVPLVKNIGFDGQATRTLAAPGPYGDIQTCPLGIISHPKFVIPDRAADEFAYLHRRVGLMRSKYGVLYPLVARLKLIRIYSHLRRLLAGVGKLSR